MEILFPYVWFSWFYSVEIVYLPNKLTCVSLFLQCPKNEKILTLQIHKLYAYQQGFVYKVIRTDAAPHCYASC